MLPWHPSLSLFLSWHLRVKHTDRTSKAFQDMVQLPYSWLHIFLSPISFGPIRPTNFVVVCHPDFIFSTRGSIPRFWNLLLSSNVRETIYAMISKLCQFLNFSRNLSTRDYLSNLCAFKDFYLLYCICDLLLLQLGSQNCG